MALEDIDLDPHSFPDVFETGRIWDCTVGFFLFTLTCGVFVNNTEYGHRIWWFYPRFFPT